MTLPTKVLSALSAALTLSAFVLFLTLNVYKVKSLSSLPQNQGTVDQTKLNSLASETALLETFFESVPTTYTTAGYSIIVLTALATVLALMALGMDFTRF